MGPSLVERARRAAPHARITAVARSGADIAVDLLDRAQIDALPDSKNVIFLAGRNSGSTGNERAHLGYECDFARDDRRTLSGRAYRRAVQR